MFRFIQNRNKSEETNNCIKYIISKYDKVFSVPIQDIEGFAITFSPSHLNGIDPYTRKTQKED
jgi:hypothetical protein